MNSRLKLLLIKNLSAISFAYPSRVLQLIGLVFILSLIASCRDFKIESKNNYFFPGLSKISKVSDNKYSFEWIRPAELPEDISPEYHLLYLGSISVEAGTELGAPKESLSGDITPVTTSEFFNSSDGNAIEIIKGQESIVLELSLDTETFHIFQVKIVDPEIPIEPKQGYLFYHSINDELTKNRGWEFAGLKLAELRGDQVFLQWDPPTGSNASNSNFAYKVYQGLGFDEVAKELQETSTTIPLTELNTSSNQLSFGVRATRLNDLVTDQNTEIKFVNLPGSIIFDGLKKENISIDSERKAVTLSWDEALSTVGNIKYHIYDNEALTNPIAVTTSLTYELTELATNKTFRFLVRAADSRGEDSNTNFVDVLIPDNNDRTPPEFDGIKTAKAISDKRAFLTWDASPSEDIESYLVYSISNLTTPLAQTSKDNTSITLTGLAKATSYSVIVRARDIAGNIDQNLKSISFVTDTLELPTFPGIQSAAPQVGIKGLSSLKLGWSPASFPEPEPESSDLNVGYNVYRLKFNDIGTAGALTDPDLFDLDKAVVTYVNQTLLGSTGSYIIDDLDACHSNTGTCKRYCFIVRAVDTRKSPPLEERNNTILCSPTAQYEEPTFTGAKVAKPVNSVDGFTKMTVSWDSATGVFEGYRVYHKRSTDFTFDLTSFVNASPTATKIEISNLIKNTSYDFLVLAYGDDPNNPNDSVANPTLYGPQNSSAIKTAITLPEAPSFGGLTKVSPGSGAAAIDSVVLEFAPATGAFNRYVFFQRQGSNSYSTVPFAINTSTEVSGTLSQTVANLTNGQTYCFYAKATYSETPNDLASVNVLSSSNSSDEEICYTVQLSPPTFTSIKSIALSDTTSSSSTAAIELKFDLASGIFNRYTIYMGTTSSEITTEVAILDANLATVGGTGTVTQCAATSGEGCFVIQNLSFESNYYFTMKAWHTTYNGLEDQTGDNLLHPASTTTGGRPNEFSILSTEVENMFLSSTSELAPLNSLDSSFLTSTINSATINNKAAFALVEFEGGADTNTETEIADIEVEIQGSGQGWDSLNTTNRYGLNTSIVKMDMFGTGADGNLLNTAGNINNQTTSNGKTKIARVYQLDFTTVVPGATQLDLSGAYTDPFANGELQVGDEVMIYRESLNNHTDVHTRKTEAGYYHFSKISAISTTQVTLETPIPTLGFADPNIYTLMVRVPQLENLTLAGDLTADAWDHWSVNTGGILVLRVAGTLNLNGHRLHMDGLGFDGGTNDSESGFGITTPTVVDSVAVLAGAGDTDRAGGGGGHGGIGGTTLNGTPGGESIGTISLVPRFFMGGAGGSQDNSCSGSNVGTSGGGIVVIFAKKIIGGGNSTISANGVDIDASSSSGAGAGGTVWIHAHSANDLQLIARGGSSLATADNCADSTDDVGAEGGGGRIRYDVLDATNITATTAAGTRAFTGGGQTANAGNGTVMIGDRSFLLESVESYDSGTSSVEVLNRTFTTDFQKFFDPDNHLYIWIESKFPTSTGNAIDSSIDIDSAKIHVNWN